MIEAIDNMGDVEEEDTDEEGNSTFKQSQPIQVRIYIATCSKTDTGWKVHRHG